MLWLAFGLPSGSEWFWIFVVVFLLFGAKKLPELARGVGRALGEFHKAREEFEREIHHSLQEPVSKPAPQTTQASSASPASAPAPEGAVPREEKKSA